MSLFTVAGVSVFNDSVKVRFCSDLVLRVKNLQKQGDTDILLIELPHPMDKWEACEFLLASDQFAAYASDIREVQSKKQPKSNIPKVSIPKVELDEEIEAIKELAVA